jgi:hypothetical protein
VTTSEKYTKNNQIGNKGERLGLEKLGIFFLEVKNLAKLP